MVDVSQLQDEAWDLRNKKGNLSGALEKINQALQSSEDVDLLLRKSTVLRDSGRIDEARSVLREVLAKVDDEQLSARADAGRLLGFLELLQGNHDEALRLAELAQADAEKAEDSEILSNTLALLGNIYHTQGELEDARSYYEQALEHAKKARFIEREITVGINIATVTHQQGDTETALEELEKLLKRTEDRWHKAYFNVLFEKTKMLRATKRLNQELVEQLQAAQQEAASLGWVDEQGNLAYELANVLLVLDQKPESLAYYKQARDVFTNAGISGKVAKLDQEIAKKFPEETGNQE